MTDTDELNPCPSGHVGTTRNNNNIYATWWVQCCTCSWRNAGHTEAEAIAAWNASRSGEARMVKFIEAIASGEYRADLDTADEAREIIAKRLECTSTSGAGSVCPHKIRWPHPCTECDAVPAPDGYRP